MGNFRVPGMGNRMSGSADIKSIVREQSRFNESVSRNFKELQKIGIDGGDIKPGSLTPQNFIQAAKINSIFYVGSQSGAPVFRQDNDFLSYDDTTHRLSLGANPILKAMTVNSIPFITTGGLLAESPTKLKWDDPNSRMTVDGALRVGSATDATTSGDLSAGLTGAARMFYGQANGRLSLFSAANAETVRISTSEDSYYNAAFKFGVGTPTPRRVLDVSAAVNQMRLTQTDNAIYADFSVDGSGILSVSPTGKQMKLAMGANGQQLMIGEETELTTIAAAATTDTAIQIPLNAVVYYVSVRVTVVIPTAATFTVTGTTSGTQFDVAGGVSTAANTTDLGTRNCPYKNGAAQTIRITPNVNPAANTGRVRVTIYYYLPVAATS